MYNSNKKYHERRNVFVSRKKINEKFLALYQEIEKECGAKFGVAEGGFAEYINRLNNARYAPDRDEVLPRLVKYKNAKGTLDSSVKKDADLAKEDIKWLADFSKKLSKKKDPVSVYLKKARSFARRRRTRKVVLALVAVALVAVAAILLLGL